MNRPIIRRAVRSALYQALRSCNGGKKFELPDVPLPDVLPYLIRPSLPPVTVQMTLAKCGPFEKVAAEITIANSVTMPLAATVRITSLYQGMMVIVDPAKNRPSTFQTNILDTELGLTPENFRRLAAMQLDSPA